MNSCTHCDGPLTVTNVGKICMQCGIMNDEIVVEDTVIISHSTLMHSEHRVPEPSEPGTGEVDTITDTTAFTAESNSTLGAFTWIQVAVSRFSYYAVVFVLVVIMAGISYGIFIRDKNETAKDLCKSSISKTSSEKIEAGVSPSPTPKCTK